ncbi:MAG TPA: nucleotide exchange factor GrpE [Intrasporangium sp.]|nr:nucleotide exchange factor GrpE [Intrasporangium sp.]
MTTSDPQGVTPEDLTPEGAGPEPAGADQGARAAGRNAGTPPPAGSPKHMYYEGGAGASAEPGGDDEYDHAPDPQQARSDGPEAALAEEDTMAATLLADLQRLQAEYVNYKRRVDRDRDLIRHAAVGGVVESLLPVLDDIHSAREAGALEDGPFAAIAEKLESILGRFGVERLGEKGEEFDPTVHEALMHVEAELPEEATSTTVVQVIQPGYRIGERLVRAARVSVADPA